MIKGIGVDIVQISRIKENFIKILSEEEKKFIKNKTSVRKKSFIAGRFAAKEAIYKAWVDCPKDLSKLILLNDKGGKLFLKNNDKIRISISHEKDFAVAFCIYLI